MVGINGSGKTSILNILNWILKPSLSNLCLTEFKLIEVKFTHKEIKYKVVCKQTETKLTYNIITAGEEKYNPLVIRIQTKPSDITNPVIKAELAELYNSLRPENKEENTWNLISSFPSPTIIGLDRNLYSSEQDQLYFKKNIISKTPSRTLMQSISPLQTVKDLVNKEYRRKKNEILQLTSNLKNHLMLSAFESITQKSFLSSGKSQMTLPQIENAEQRVKNYFSDFEKKPLTSEQQVPISRYFSDLKDITKKFEINPNDKIVAVLYGLNATQFLKLNKLLQEFEKFEEQSLGLFSGINNYLETVNFFFKDSAKKLIFNEDTAELTFDVLNQKKAVISEFRDIGNLSSGEEQLLVLFSYVAFSEEKDKIFIIDEPELSLHIKWQEDFLEQLNNITPASTQLIFATHSPILANKRKDKTIVLLPYNV